MWNYMPASALSPSGGPVIHQGKGGAMKSTDEKKQARIVVSDRLRLFFSHLKQQLTSGTEDLWKRVETKLNETRERP